MSIVTFTGETALSDDDTNKTADSVEQNKSTAGTNHGEQEPHQTGPNFEKGPDPLAGMKKGAEDVLSSMDGKSVSMKTYVGTIIGVVVLMLLARCGG